MPAAFFRAAARSLVPSGLGYASRKAGNNPVGGPDKPVARDLRGDPRNKPAPYSPALPQRSLSAAAWGTEAGSMTIRLLDRPTSEAGAGTPRVEGWRARSVRRLDIYHRESQKKIF